MRRSIPEPHLTDRRTMWRAAGLVLAVAVVMTVVEVFASSEPIASAWSGLFPFVGAAIAPILGPRLRPRSSFAVESGCGRGTPCLHGSLRASA